MNNRSYLLLSLTALLFASAPGVRAQTSSPSPVFTRPRVVSAAQQQPTPSAPAQSQNTAPRLGTQPAPAARLSPFAPPSTLSHQAMIAPPSTPASHSQPTH